MYSRAAKKAKGFDDRYTEVKLMPSLPSYEVTPFLVAL